MIYCNRLGEAILIDPHNIWFYNDLKEEVNHSYHKKRCHESPKYWDCGITVKPVLSSHSKEDKIKDFQDWLSLNAGQKYCRMGAFCNTFDLHLATFYLFLSGHLSRVWLYLGFCMFFFLSFHSEFYKVYCIWLLKIKDLDSISRLASYRSSRNVCKATKLSYWYFYTEHL